MRITSRIELTELDFTDDRLTQLLMHLSRLEVWQAIEQIVGDALSVALVAEDDLRALHQATIRLSGVSCAG